MTEDEPLPAGGFAEWLAGMERSLRGEADSDVPCGGCTACCTSSQFVHIEPDEVETLAHIPADLLFPAPRLPRGNVLLGYDERGHCPMLVDGACSIYAHRPRTCRIYDCRVFPATGVEIDDPAQRRDRGAGPALALRRLDGPRPPAARWSARGGAARPRPPGAPGGGHRPRQRDAARGAGRPPVRGLDPGAELIGASRPRIVREP